MKKVFAIAFKDVLTTFRDKKALIMIIVMPMVLIGILGASFGQMFDKDAQIPEFKVAIVDNDKGLLAGEIKDIMNFPDLKKLIKSELISEGAAREGIKDNKLVAALIIPENFSSDVMAGKKAKLDIIADPGKPTEANIFKGVIDRFATGASGITIGFNITMTQLTEKGISPQAIPAMTPLILGDLQKAAEKPVVEINNETTEGSKKQLKSFQYYSAGMGVMFMLFAGMFGIKSILVERKDQTLMRMMSTTTTNTTIIAGKFVGMICTGFVQILIMIILTSLIYGVHWGNSYAGIGVMALTTVFAIAGMSIFVAAISKTERSAEMLASIGIQIISMLGGSMVPIHMFPKFLQAVSKVTVNKWAIQGFSDMMLDKGFSTIIQPSLVLVAIGAVFAVVGAWRLRLE